MKILMSAFSCTPGRGSEPGVGWNWAVQAARKGHEVTVLTQICDRAQIEEEIAAGGVPAGLSFDFLMPGWLERFRQFAVRRGYHDSAIHIVHLIWQFHALGHVRRRYARGKFDLVHHVTFACIRHPTFLGRTKMPLVLGPIGGGDRVPFRLRRHATWSAALWELMRDVHTFLVRFDPITRRACADAMVIYASTPGSKSVLPARHHHKTAIYSQCGCPPMKPAARRARHAGEPLRLLFSGRFMHFKGMDLGLQAVARARRQGIDVRLTMAGAGPEEEAWRRLAINLGVDDIVDWRGWVSLAEMDRLYETHDVLLFPSLRESVGGVVLEAMSNGLPVICVDLGGPGILVDSACGRVVGAKAQTQPQIIEGLVAAIAEIARSPALQVELSRGALARAEFFAWPNQVGRLYADVAERLRERRDRQRGKSDRLALSRPAANA